MTTSNREKKLNQNNHPAIVYLQLDLTKFNSNTSQPWRMQISKTIVLKVLLQNIQLPIHFAWLFQTWSVDWLTKEFCFGGIVIGIVYFKY